MRALAPLMLVLALAGCATTDADPTAGLVDPEITSRTIDGDLVEEYRVQGQLQIVKVTPKRGAPYYLIDQNGDGRLDSSEGEGPISPVMWKIFQWD